MFWNLTKDRGFSVESLYGQITYAESIQMPFIWKVKIPHRVMFFAWEVMWEVMWGRILTLDNIKRRGVTLVNRSLLGRGGNCGSPPTLQED